MFDGIRSTALRLVRRITKRSRQWGEGDDDDFDMDFGSTTPSGVKLTRSKAYSVSSWYRAINILSATVAKTPIDVLTGGDGGANELDPLHAVSLLFSGHGQPNPETLRYHFVQTLTAHAAGHGGGFAYIFWDGTRPVELLQLRPDRTYPVRQNGQLYFVTTIGGELGSSGSETIKLLPENVLHIHGLGYDGLTGYSLLKMASRALGSAIAKEEFGSRFFANSATPSVAIKVPKKLTPKAFKNLQNSWVKLRTGLTNAHKPVILEEGADIEPFSHSAADSQLLAAMEQDPVLVSNFTGVPPHLLGVKGYNSYNSLEIQSQDLLDYAVDPLFVPWEQELCAKLLREDEKRGYTRKVRFRRRDLVRVDFAKRYSGYRTALGGHPFRTVNAVRKDEGEAPVDGFDFIPVPLNMSSTPDSQPADPPTNPDGTPAAPAGDAQRQAVRSLAESTIARMCGRIVRAAAVATHDKPEHAVVLREAFDPLCILAGCVGRKVTGETISAEMLRSVGVALRENKLDQWLETTPARLLESIFGKAS